LYTLTTLHSYCKLSTHSYGGFSCVGLNKWVKVACHPKKCSYRIEELTPFKPARTNAVRPTVRPQREGHTHTHTYV